MATPISSKSLDELYDALGSLNTKRNLLIAELDDLGTTSSKNIERKEDIGRLVDAIEGLHNKIADEIEVKYMDVPSKPAHEELGEKEAPTQRMGKWVPYSTPPDAEIPEAVKLAGEIAIGEAIPPVGFAIDMNDLMKAIAVGSIVGIAAAGFGFLPFIGGPAKAAFKAIRAGDKSAETLNIARKAITDKDNLIQLSDYRKKVEPRPGVERPSPSDLEPGPELERLTEEEVDDIFNAIDVPESEVPFFAGEMTDEFYEMFPSFDPSRAKEHLAPSRPPPMPESKEAIDLAEAIEKRRTKRIIADVEEPFLDIPDDYEGSGMGRVLWSDSDELAEYLTKKHAKKKPKLDE